MARETDAVVLPRWARRQRVLRLIDLLGFRPAAVSFDQILRQQVEIVRKHGPEAVLRASVRG